jgi:hypothetical protein
MKVTITLTKYEAEHIRVHSFSDNCLEVWTIMEKVQEEVNKKLKY